MVIADDLPTSNVESISMARVQNTYFVCYDEDSINTPKRHLITHGMYGSIYDMSWWTRFQIGFVYIDSKTIQQISSIYIGIYSNITHVFPPYQIFSWTV